FFSKLFSRFPGTCRLICAFCQKVRIRLLQSAENSGYKAPQALSRAGWCYTEKNKPPENPYFKKIGKGGFYLYGTDQTGFCPHPAQYLFSAGRRQVPRSDRGPAAGTGS